MAAPNLIDRAIAAVAPRYAVQRLQARMTLALAGYGAGAWVRDECRALPQSETCARLSDELSELRTRFFNAMPSERDRITIRERGITARLAADCGR